MGPMRTSNLALPAVLAGDAAHSLAADKPDIVLVMADDVGDQAIGCYGGTSCANPRIDASAVGGLRIRPCHSMPVCHPMRFALITGMYLFRPGLPPRGTFPRNLESEAVAHRLRELGSAIAAVGRWQLTLMGEEAYPPRRPGFDSWSLFGCHDPRIRMGRPRFFRKQQDQWNM